MTEFEIAYTVTPALARRLHWAAYPTQAVLDVLLPPLFLLNAWATGQLLWVLPAVVTALLALWRLRTFAALSAVGQEVTVRFTASAVHVVTPDTTSSRRWSAYTWAAFRGGCWVLRVGPTARFGFPASALDAAQTRAFRAMLRQNGVPVRGPVRRSAPPSAV